MCSITSDIQFYCIEIKIGEVPILYLFLLVLLVQSNRGSLKVFYCFGPISAVKSYCTITYRFLIKKCLLSLYFFFLNIVFQLANFIV